MIAVDTNILIYAHRAEFPEHVAARKLLADLAEGPELWALPVFCLGEFLRVVTHPAILKPPSDLPAAKRSLEALLDSPSVRVLSPGDRFLNCSCERSPTPGPRETSSSTRRSPRSAARTASSRSGRTTGTSSVSKASRPDPWSDWKAPADPGRGARSDV